MIHVAQIKVDLAPPRPDRFRRARGGQDEEAQRHPRREPARVRGRLDPRHHLRHVLHRHGLAVLRLVPGAGQKGIDGVVRRVVGAMPLRDAPVEHEPDALAHAARGRRLAGPQQRGDDADDIVAGDGIDRSIGERRRVREAASPVRLVAAPRLPPARAQRDARIEPPRRMSASSRPGCARRWGRCRDGACARCRRRFRALRTG